jgi:hypothetical protein
MHHLGKGDDIEYRYPNKFLNGVGEWHQVGAFDNQRTQVRVGLGQLAGLT